MHQVDNLSVLPSVLWPSMPYKLQYVALYQKSLDTPAVTLFILTVQFNKVKR